MIRLISVEALVEHRLVVRVETRATVLAVPAVSRPWTREEVTVCVCSVLEPIHHHVLRRCIIICVGSCGMIASVTVSEYRRHMECWIRELSVDAVSPLDLTLSRHIPIITANITSIIVTVGARRRNFICRRRCIRR
jgi:hypothetical protein